MPGYSGWRFISSFTNRPPWSGTLIGVIKYSTFVVRRSRSKESVERAISDQELRECAEDARQRFINLGLATCLNDGAWTVSAAITSEYAPRAVIYDSWSKRWGLEIRIEASAAKN